ncbi:MAG TPA: type II toxin-antitoxin system VapC family toxin [Candidatus Dormibacteraeota bacterium]|nr:type II toxin-antitoxin system VapC family toxin [Candidatus Dormibacteraeota bacterium]
MGRALSVLDASVLIALLDEKDVGRPVARAAVGEAQRDHDLLIPVTAFSESIVAPYRRSRRDGERAEAALAALGRLVDVSRDIASRAARLRATRQIKLPDALILATAMQVSAEQILTLDRRWRGVDSRVRLLEP